MKPNGYTKVCMALPSLLLAMCLFVLGTIVVPEVRQIRQNTAVQNERLWGQVRAMEKALDKMKLQIALVSIMPPTQAIKLETTDQWRNLFELIGGSQ